MAWGASVLGPDSCGGLFMDPADRDDLRCRLPCTCPHGASLCVLCFSWCGDWTPRRGTLRGGVWEASVPREPGGRCKASLTSPQMSLKSHFLHVILVTNWSLSPTQIPRRGELDPHLGKGRDTHTLKTSSLSSLINAICTK